MEAKTRRVKKLQTQRTDMIPVTIQLSITDIVQRMSPIRVQTSIIIQKRISSDNTCLKMIKQRLVKHQQQTSNLECFFSLFNKLIFVNFENPAIFLNIFL